MGVHLLKAALERGGEKRDPIGHQRGVIEGGRGRSAVAAPAVPVGLKLLGIGTLLRGGMG